MSPLNRILVTGAGGFVGRALLPHLHRAGASVIAAVREQRPDLDLPGQTIRMGDLTALPDWGPILRQVDAVIHLAARAHVTSEHAPHPLAEFRAANVAPALSLFTACQQASLARFVFVSSIGVNGVLSPGSAFRETDRPNPVEPYAISKWEAEQALLEQASRGSTELVIVRPVLIYGPHAKGNLLRLMRWIDSGWPLPFGSLRSARSLLGLGNFCDLLNLCVTHPSAGNQLFVAADAQSTSTQGLIAAIAEEMNRKVRLAKLPPGILRLAGSAIGTRSEMNRLVGSLEVDASKARVMLNWRSAPIFSTDLRAMVDQYLVAARNGGRDRPK
jgi:nucleoside-diphosphate-sugar epimerase